MTLAIQSATADELSDACRALFAHGEHAALAARRFLAMFAEGELDPRGLLVAKDGDAIRGTIFTYRLGGAQAALWLPVAPDDATRDALVAGALAWIHREPTKVIQTLIREPERSRTDALVRAGFRYITQLAFLSRTCSPEDAKFVPKRLHFRPVSQLDGEFADVLMQTFDGTLDVPELNGTRSTDEVLAGYRRVAGDEPPLYWMIECERATVGVLMLTPHSDDPTIELTYVGLVPSARGRGLGREAVDFALARAANSARHSVQLNVDVRNEPALGIYRDRMFRTDDLRDVYLLLPQ